ncbi:MULTISPECIES: hypothetical protein [unclassified Methanoculleus]|jgi:hypothetical protein|uniref:Uncharacterized protein n=1 Tax=Methanoculleus palmolei TaxID=72612 RepID=A0ABD8A694_9EURY|nr:hypothetical protein [Methanoculleus sp. UBA377]WOX55075.1 hypothetical protein R6Y95_06255 [Methanoculleus palmolei]
MTRQVSPADMDRLLLDPRCTPAHRAVIDLKIESGEWVIKAPDQAQN